MIELDGREYYVNTPEENTAIMVTRINKYCANHNITNSKGEVIEIAANWANPLYVILYGLSYLITQCQSLIYSAGCALSVPASSDRQLLNIADLAHVHRKAATKTIITGTVYGMLATDGAAVPARITTDLTYTVETVNGNVSFSPAFDITVPVGSSRTIILIATTYGSYSLNQNDSAVFDTPVDGLRLMKLNASTPGQAQETISALRRRLQSRVEKGTMLDNAMNAISELDGVALCNIYFNKSVVDTETVMGIAVPPRQALVFVQGWSNDIAKTFFSNIVCQCAGADSPQAICQTYTTEAGQVLTVPVIPPENVPCYIRIWVNQVVDDVTKGQMRDTIATLAQERTIGQILTSADILQVLNKNYPSFAWAGCQVALDQSEFQYQIQPGPYQLAVFDYGKIDILGTE